MVSSSTFFTSSLGFLSVRNSLKKAILLRRTCSTISAVLAVDFNSSCMLVLRGKSPMENKIAEALKNTNALKLSDNSELPILLDSESEKPLKGGETFGIDSFMHSLSTDRFGRFLLWSLRLPSTQDVVSQNFYELPNGAVCVADVQYKGRGQMEDARIVPLIQYVMSLAITEAIKDVCDKNGLAYIDLRIKWPNDLYLNGLKVGGILCTSTSSTCLLVSA